MSDTINFARTTIEDYAKTHEKDYIINKMKLEDFYNLCAIADFIGEKLEDVTCILQVDPQKIEGVIRMEVEDFEVGRKVIGEFFDKLRSADFIRFEKIRNDLMGIEFGISNLWVHL